MSLLARFLGSLTTATTVFVWDGSAITLRKGKASSRISLGIQRLLRDEQSPPATISLRKNGRIEYSSSLPSSLHQRIRNIIHTD